MVMAHFSLPLCLYLNDLFTWKAEQQREDGNTWRHREIFHLTVHPQPLPDGVYNSQIWTRPKSRAKNSILVSLMWVAGAQVLGLSSVVFPGALIGS